MLRNLNYLRHCFRVSGIRFKSSNVEINENEPVKFSTSRAASRGPVPLISKINDDMPWYQPYVVIGSVAIFMLYFCVLREESDIDREFDKTLYDRIKGLEKEQLLQSYRYNKEHGKSVIEIEERLLEIEKAEKELQL
ncbi:uncharacterized protein LOC119628355 [Bombyx mori]|uniref:Uncharacterized protein n=1 Tax=Bombyx mori TaxID=7091 RepID=A0A8R2C603_BOMMO|nr:uncharacterized protein LOC119628355 [Bombyx mori]